MSPRKKTPEQLARSEAKRLATEAQRRIFLAWCRSLRLPEPVPEHEWFPSRHWRFDWAWPRARVALEIQGGAFINGRHSRGPALRREYEKLNTAAVHDWVVVFALAGEVQTPTMGETLKLLVGGRHP